jgi:hypothetical protein
MKKKNFQEQARQHILMILAMNNITEEEFFNCESATQFKELFERKKAERRNEDDKARTE